MILRAKVKRATGATRHTRISGPGRIEAIPTPAYVEIRPRPDGTVFLLHLNEKSECIADTWHMTVDEAKRQAAMEFAIGEGDWAEVLN